MSAGQMSFRLFPSPRKFSRNDNYGWPSMSVTPSSFGIHDKRRLVQICCIGRPSALGSLNAPSRNVYDFGFFSAHEYTGEPQFAQKAWVRRAPLSATLTYSRGLPVRMRKPSAGAGMPARNAVPESIWQSWQWHTLTVPGFTSASYVISPQWQRP